MGRCGLRLRHLIEDAAGPRNGVAMNSTSGAPRDLRRLVLHGIGWTAVEKWGIRLMSLVVFIILLRTIDASEFGLASFTTAITSILLVFVDAGFAKALIQKRTLGRDDATTAFWTSLGIAVVVYGVIFFTAPLIAAWTDMEPLGAMLRVLGLSLFASAMSSVPAALLEREMNFKSLGLRSIFGTVVGAMIAVPMALFGMGVWALVAQMLATLTAGTFALWFSTSWRPSMHYSVASLRELMSFGISVLGLEILNRTQQNIDKVLVNVLLGPEAGGIYFVAQRAMKLVSELIASVISKIALTTFSKLQDDRERLNRAFLQLTFAAGGIAVPVLGIIAALGDIIMPYMSGAGEWEAAVPIMQILAVSMSMAAICRFDKQTLLAVGQPARAFGLGLIENIVGVTLLVIAAPFGLIALAVGRALRIILTWPYRLYLLKKHAGIRILPYMLNTAALAGAFLAPIGILLLGVHTPWRDTTPAFWTFAVPMSVVMLIAYYGALWLVCGRRNRAVIGRTLRIGRRRTRNARP